VQYSLPLLRQTFEIKNLIILGRTAEIDFKRPFLLIAAAWITLAIRGRYLNLRGLIGGRRQAGSPDSSKRESGSAVITCTLKSALSARSAHRLQRPLYTSCVHRATAG